MQNTMLLIVLSCLVAVVFGQHQHHLNTHELQQLVDSGFLTLDVNPKDGLLEYAELSKLFDQRDTDGDGNLSKAEFEAHVGLDFLFKDPLFNLFDTDKNGLLSKAEFVDKAYHDANNNGDGQVTRHEFDHYYSQLLHHLNTHHG
ncbi:uncharacterized protein LOC133196647 [Saccostrea echinata]|uniref:uncharacterized protein LOC133196647 n=1 Tax=Saccostrea echinata TaxID=191078 RepID=UPI002A7FAD57|nr:uncharacterized protein LOC133196647 [Saccostrea echinata]